LLGIAFACVLFCAIPRSAAQTAPGGVAYYVDCSSAAQKNDGRSADSAGSTLEQVNGHAFAAGDEVRFKRGSICRGMLWPQGSGSDSAPIRMTSYGTGVRPKIVAASGSDVGHLLDRDICISAEVRNVAGILLVGKYETNIVAVSCNAWLVRRTRAWNSSMGAKYSRSIVGVSCRTRKILSKSLRCASKGGREFIEFGLCSSW
jgi:hypothetical protein